MTTSQVRLLAALSCVLLALSSALWLWEPEASVADPGAKKVLEPVDPTTAVGIEIVQNAGERQDTISLQKKEGIWVVRAPFEADADPDQVIAILDALREAAAGVPVEGALKSFGLDPPQATVTLTDQEGSQQKLVLGNAAPAAYRTYVLAADGTAAAVRGKPGEHLLKRAGEYRDHKIFRYDPGEVIRVSVRGVAGLLEATKTEHGWFLTNYGPVDLNQLDDWITGLLMLRTDLFLDLDHTEIADPRYVVEVETDDGVQRMWVGRDTPYGPLVLFGDGLDGVVEPGLLAQLERRPSAVGATVAFPFDVAEDTAIVLKGDAELRIPKADFDSYPVIVDALSLAAPVYVGADDKTLPPPIWTGPELTVQFEGPAGLREVEIGPIADAFRTVKDVHWPSAVRVPAEELAPLFR